MGGGGGTSQARDFALARKRPGASAGGWGSSPVHQRTPGTAGCTGSRKSGLALVGAFPRPLSPLDREYKTFGTSLIVKPVFQR